MADQGQKSKGVVDIVFLLDATGSMATCIDALKKNIEVFIDNLVATDPNSSSIVKDWRARVVGYRDFEADSTPYVDNAFVRDTAALKGQLTALKADGGGDEPESLLDALFKISTVGNTAKGATEDAQKWRYRSEAARVVIVFTDASYKTKMAIPEAAGGGFEDVKNKIQENRIILSVFAPDMPCYDQLSQLDKAEYQPIGSAGSNPQQALADFTANQANFKATLEALAKSVSKSADTAVL